MTHQFSSASTQAVWVCIALTLVSQLVLTYPSGKRQNFFHLECKGQYNKSVFARLDRICEDCYNLFREPEIHTLCREDCFTSEVFQGCIEILLITDEIELMAIHNGVEILGK
nr:crustacean hyperglycemic hormone isoform X2 [Onthophagus taurus]